MTEEEWAALLALLARLFDPVKQAEREVRAAYETEHVHTHPWCWYCRLCGAEEEAANRQDRDVGAYAHLGECQHRSHRARPHLGWAEAGRLVHVWTY